MSEVLNCPCCDSDNVHIYETRSKTIYHDSYSIECGECGLGIHKEDYLDELITNWNKRSSSSQKKTIAEVVELLQENNTLDKKTGFTYVNSPQVLKSIDLIQGLINE